jgi:hypothetical protein
MLAHFDLRDEDGRALPMLTRSQNAQTAAEVLASMAETLLGHEPLDLLDKRLRIVPAGDDDVAEAVANDLRAVADQELALRRNETEAARAARATKLPRDDWRYIEEVATLLTGPYRRVLGELTANFLLLTPITPEPGRRRVIKLAYDEPFEAVGGNLRSLAVALGFAHARVELQVTTAAKARTYHCELVAPADVEIREAVLFATRGQGEGDAFHGSRGRVHLLMTRVSPDAVGFVLASLRARRSGFLRAALLTSALATALLALGFWRFSLVSARAEASAPLLLLAPGLLAAYLLRPGEHALASALLLGVRAMVLLSGFCAVAATTLLLIGSGTPFERFTWATLFYASAAATLGLALSNLLPALGRVGGTLGAGPE